MNIERIEIQIAMLNKQVITASFINPEKIAAIMAADDLMPAEVIMDILDEENTNVIGRIAQIAILVDLDEEVLDAKFRTKRGINRMIENKEPFRDLILDIINHDKYEARSKKADKKSV